MRTLIVIDMQNDFIDGSLGSSDAVAIVGNVVAKIKEYRDNGDEVIFTRDTHGDDYLNTSEGKHLPVVHCIEGTKGWEISDKIDVGACEIINKPSFGYTGWAGREFESLELVGLCTDICVVSNAMILKALYPEIPMKVDANCCAGVSKETHEAALITMQTCQIEIVR